MERNAKTKILGQFESMQMLYSFWTGEFKGEVQLSGLSVHNIIL